MHPLKGPTLVVHSARRPPGLFAGSDGRVMLYGHFGLFERDGPDGTWNEVSLAGRTASRPFEFAGELWVSSLAQAGGTSALMRLGEAAAEPFAPIMCHLTGRDADREIHLASQPLGYFVLRPDMRSLPAPIRLPWLSPAGPSIRGPDGALWLSRGAKTLRYQPDGIPPETEIVPPDPVVSHGGLLQLDVRGLECFVPAAAQNGFRYSWRSTAGLGAIGKSWTDPWRSRSRQRACTWRRFACRTPTWRSTSRQRGSSFASAPFRCSCARGSGSRCCCWSWLCSRCRRSVFSRTADCGDRQQRWRERFGSARASCAAASASTARSSSSRGTRCCSSTPMAAFTTATRPPVPCWPRERQRIAGDDG